MPENLMRRVVRAFANSDLQPLFDAIDDGIVWKTAASAEGVFPFAAEYDGRTGVIEITSRLARSYTFWRIEPKEITGRGDVVWGLFQVDADYMPRGKHEKIPIQFECAIRWRVRNGKILEHQAFFDTAAVFAQQQSRGLRTLSAARSAS